MGILIKKYRTFIFSLGGWGGGGGLRKGGPISGLRGSYNWNKNFCLQIDRPITEGAYNRYFTMSIINVREKISLSHSRIFSPYILPR